MPILFSPVTEAPLESARYLFPRSAFLICQQSDVPIADVSMIEIAQRSLTQLEIDSVDAANFRRTGDYLTKILEQIRGAGFCIAIFSEGTRTKTLANIFLEVGMAYLLGKPVVILKTAQASVPSDLVRSEYIEYNGDADQTLDSLKNTIRNSVLSAADYMMLLAELAEDAEDPDYELAFHRYLQAILFTGDRNILTSLERVKDAFAISLRASGADAIRKRILADMKLELSILQRKFETR
ncbi:hypothetical protein [Kordiimonas sp.]|uniref:hypothetical protein n=1 Tax=Kordiimonas sp. TaxID=1970157 RepID=UPI003A924E9A